MATNRTRLFRYISDVYVTIDSVLIIRNTQKYNQKIIERPKAFGGKDVSYCNAILCGLLEIEEGTGKTADFLMIFIEDMDEGIEMIISDSSLDSVMSVFKFNMFNPYKAYKQKRELANTVVSQNFIRSY